MGDASVIAPAGVDLDARGRSANRGAESGHGTADARE
jgi:hypothetical protein